MRQSADWDSNITISKVNKWRSPTLFFFVFLRFATELFSGRVSFRQVMFFTIVPWREKIFERETWDWQKQKLCLSFIQFRLQLFEQRPKLGVYSGSTHLLALLDLCHQERHQTADDFRWKTRDFSHESGENAVSDQLSENAIPQLTGSRSSNDKINCPESQSGLMSQKVPLLRETTQNACSSWIFPKDCSTWFDSARCLQSS